MTNYLVRGSIFFVFVAVTVVAVFFVAPSSVQAAGVFRVSDYGSGAVAGGWFWRGYHFQVTEETVVTHLVGGGTNGGDFAIAIFGVTVPGDSDPDYAYQLDSIIASVVPPGGDPDQSVALAESVTLLPGVDYMLAQGRVEGSSSHHRVDFIDVDNLLLGSPRISLWLPSSGQSINYGITGSVESMLGRTASNFNDTRPRIGFLFESVVTPSNVTTLAPSVDGAQVVLPGRIDTTGGGVTSRYIEFDNRDDFQTSTLRLLGNTTEDDSSYSATETLSAGTYYFRAAGINEAGRTNADTLSFTLYTLEYQAGDNGTIEGPANQAVINDTDGVEVTAVPDEGFFFVSWDDGSTNPVRTEISVNESASYAATFATSTYTVVFGAGSGGTVTGSTTQIVTHGNSSESVEAVPDQDYQFVTWSDGVTENPRVLNDVVSSKSIQAEFKRLAAPRRSSGSVVSQVRILESRGENERAEQLRQRFPAVFSNEESEDDVSAQTEISYTLTQLQAQLQQLLETYRSLTGRDFVVDSNPNIAGAPVRDLEFGMEGEDVRQLQTLLIGQGYSIPAGATGFFANQTQSALVAYQTANSINPSTGYFGHITRTFMKTAGLSGLWW